MGYSVGIPERSFFVSWLEAVSGCESVDQLNGHCVRMAEQLELPHLAFGVVGAENNRLHEATPIVAFNNWSPEWLARYVDRGYFRLDKIVRHSMVSSLPLAWDNLAFSDRSKDWRRLQEDAEDYGLRVGISCGVGHPFFRGVISLASDDRAVDKRRLKTLTPEVVTLGTYLYAAAERLFAPTAGMQPLSSREKDCLLWSAEGKTASEIASILGITERTVVFHLTNAQHKLSASNKQHAVAKAVANRLIIPSL